MIQARTKLLPPIHWDLESAARYAKFILKQFIFINPKTRKHTFFINLFYITTVLKKFQFSIFFAWPAPSYNFILFHLYIYFYNFSAPSKSAAHWIPSAKTGNLLFSTALFLRKIAHSQKSSMIVDRRSNLNMSLVS